MSELELRPINFDFEDAAACVTLADGTTVSALHHYDPKTRQDKFLVPDGNTVVDVTGQVVEWKVGACPVDVECVESQEWTYGIDNSGTIFNDIATYCLELSDGSVLEWSQDGSSNNWTPQLQEWSANIQAAADAAGLLWFVEPRFVDNRDPSNIDGSSAGSPSGLPGAPSVPIAEALFAGGMSWRYVNFQICPGQPVPVRAFRKTSQIYGDGVYDLTAAGAVLGPIQKFWLCTECGSAPIWYLADGVTLAEAGQIPNCWEPCGTLTLAESPPDRACEFFFASACDNQNDPDPLSWIQDITRRTTVCNGEVLSVDYLSADPGDPTSLVPYDLIGAFVDCASGEPIAEETPNCRDYVSVGNLWKFVPQGEVGTLIEWWELQTGNGAPHDTPSNIFSLVGGTYTHPNGAPDASYLSPTFSATTSAPAFVAGVGASSSADTNRTDQLKLSGYVNMPRAGVVSDTNGNTGERGLFAIQYCCEGDLVTIAERTTDSVPGDAGIFTNVELPAGIHYVEIMTSDLSAWQGMQFSLSLDGGATTQPFISSTGKPYFECIPVLKCLDSGLLVHAETGVVVEVGLNDSWCEPKCVSPVSAGTSTVAGPSAEDIATAMVLAERDSVEGRVVKFLGNATQQLPVAAGQRGNLLSIEDSGGGLVYFSLDGSVPSNTAGAQRGEVTGPYHASYNLRNIDLSQVRFDGSAGSADYTVWYEVFI